MSQSGQASLLDGIHGHEKAGVRAGASSGAGMAGWRKPVAVGFALISIGVMAFVVVRGVKAHSNSPDQLSRKRTVVDAESNKVFVDFRISTKEGFPFTNPDTGRRTLYPAEACYWTKDGKAKLTPTYVLLNMYVGKTEATICPDCGRKVVAHNPTPPDALLIEAAKSVK